MRPIINAIRAACLTGLVACGDSTGPATTALFYYKSSPGEYVGAGESERLVFGVGQWQALPNPTGVVEHVRIVVGGLPGAETWDLDFAAPPGQALTVGTYESAMRYLFAGPQPGLSVNGHARGCNTLTGRFVVHEISLGPGPVVERFRATFEQHCEGAPPLLSGSISLGIFPRW
jgi:hypothetical protein